MKKIVNLIPENTVRLYSCKATVSKDGLVSYYTPIVAITDECINMHLVHTSTTMMHTRKYVQFLREHGEKATADIVEGLYRLCIDKHVNDAAYSSDDGAMSVIE